MASEYEALRDDIAALLARASGNTQGIAAAILHLIAERTKEITEPMTYPDVANVPLGRLWTMLHAASALYPPRAAKDVEGERG